MSTADQNNAGSVIAYEPYSEIRKVIGQDIPLTSIFTPERIQAAAQVIKTAREKFFEITETELKMLENLVGATVVHADEYIAFSDGVAAHAINIKGQAEILGYTLIARITTKISAYCNSSQHPQKVRDALLKKMVETLRLAYQQRIMDEGGPAGKEILGILESLK